jgi:predicted transcriptional regulator
VNQLFQAINIKRNMTQALVLLKAYGSTDGITVRDLTELGFKKSTAYRYLAELADQNPPLLIKRYLGRKGQGYYYKYYCNKRYEASFKALKACFFDLLYLKLLMILSFLDSETSLVHTLNAVAGNNEMP